MTPRSLKTLIAGGLLLSAASTRSRPVIGFTVCVVIGQLLDTAILNLVF